MVQSKLKILNLEETEDSSFCCRPNELSCSAAWPLVRLAA